MKLIQVKEAAERLGVSRQTLENWGRDGTLKIRKTGAGNAHWVDEDTISSLGDTMQEVAHAREMLNKELADIRAEYRKERDLLCDIRREVMMAGKFRNSIDNKEFYLAIPAMLNVIDVLNDRETQIMIKVIDGEDIGAIADFYGLTRSRISQIFYKSCRKASRLLDLKDKLDELEKIKLEMAELKGVLKAMSQELESYRIGEQKKKEMDAAIRLEYIKNKDELLKLLSTPLMDCDLSVRTQNCLKAYQEYGQWKEIETIGDLCKLRKTDLLKQRNLGKKSLIELTEFLEELGLSFGMDVDSIYRERLIESLKEEKDT